MTRILYPITSTFLDYPSPIDNALVVVMMGCNNNCVNCQNPKFKNHECEEGKEVTVEELINDLVLFSERNRTNKIVLSGGDPLSDKNIDFTKLLLNNMKEYDFCIYTGHNIEYVKENNIDAQFIKCGNYIPTCKQESKKTNDYMMFASSNQQLYNREYCLLSKNGVYLF